MKEKAYFIQEGETPVLWTAAEISSYVQARVDLIREMQAQQAELQVKIDAYKAAILPHLVAVGLNTWRDAYGTTRLVMPQEVVTFDPVALDALVKADRYKYGYLTRFRGVDVVVGGIEVK